MNTLNFIADTMPATEILKTISGKTVFSIEIKQASDIQKINLQYIHSKSFYLNTSCYLSLYFNFNTKDAKQTITELVNQKNTLIQLFFHPHYEKINGQPVLFFNLNGEKNEVNEALISSITAYCTQQGFDGIKCIYTGERTVSSINNFSFLHQYQDLNSFTTAYFHLLSKEFYIAQYYGILKAPQNIIGDMIHSKLKTEANFKKEFPAQFNFAKQYCFFKKQVSLLENELECTKEDLKNQKIYLKIIKEQDEALKINEFYQNEYEILPLWYKKFGHVIKVLMGKRAWRSLFDNNVKKYKH